MRLARPDERRRWDATMAEQHPLGFRHAGRGLRYVAMPSTSCCSLIGWQSGAFKCRPRDLWIGWPGSLACSANNTRMPNFRHHPQSCQLCQPICGVSAATGSTDDPPASDQPSGGTVPATDRRRGASRSNGRTPTPCRGAGRPRTAAVQHPRVAPADVPLPSLLQEFLSASPIIAVMTGSKFRLAVLLAIVACVRRLGVDWRYISLRTSCGATSAPGTTIHPPAPPSMRQ